MRHLLLALLLTLPTWADPCGMVPPISLDGAQNEIARVGEQVTYAFYKDGLETIVIHPGFRGNVDQFGMLIPLPEPPALRKVPETTLDHLRKALDPPTITYWLHLYDCDDSAGEGGAGLVLSAPSEDRDQVVVVKEEAVGMYEIAVLEAGSASALKSWMDRHGYRFPDGMESTCGDYIKQKWCFVAVKTRVGSKKGVQPRPGMRSTDPSKPKGAVFTGKVQAMGFRFRSPELVVPMRLSTFNEGDLNNTLYVLTDQPVRASNLPLDLVKRQLTGDKLYKNLTDLLPYRIEGGSKDDMSPNDWKSLKSQRNPVAQNGVAGQIFSSDLLAHSLGRLTHSHEEKEKALLDIGERLNLRGGRLDQLHNTELATDRAEVKAQALSALRGMTLTLIQGEFPREVIANQNIHFSPHQLKTIEGLAQAEFQHAVTPVSPPQNRGITMLALTFGVALTLLLGNKYRRATVLTALALATLVGGSPQVQAQDGIKTATDWINLLDEPERSKEALKRLEERGLAAYPYLIARYKNEEASVTERGYCLALLTENPDHNVEKAVWEVASKGGSPLVKLWSQAALVSLAESPKELLALVDQQYAKKHGNPDYPNRVIPINGELQRPVALKLMEWDSKLTLEQRLRFMGVAQRSGQPSNVSPTILMVIAPSLKDAKISDLVHLMFSSDGQEVRRLSAALLAGFKGDKRKAVFASVMEKLQVNSKAKNVPWAGGALFLPQFSSMNKSEAQELITGLTRWSVWTDLHETPVAQVKPLENNLRSYSLWTAAGGGNLNWRSAKGGKEWLQAFGKLRGPEAVAALLREQNVPQSSSYWAVVKLLR